MPAKSGGAEALTRDVRSSAATNGAEGAIAALAQHAEQGAQCDEGPVGCW